MDVVTNISKTKREYNVTFNDEITLRLDKKVIDKLTIMDEVDMEELIRESYDYLYESGLNLSLNYLSYAIRCEMEIITYLEKKHFPQIVINDILNRLLELRYVNDYDYSQSFIRTKVASLNGRNKIKNDLLKKGIKPDIVYSSLNEHFSEEEERENLIEFITKQNNKHRNLFLREKKDKIINAAIRKGYDYKLINSLIDEYISEDDSLNENEKIKEKIRKRFYRYLNKGEDLKSVKYKVYSFFYNKGYSEEILNNVYEEIESQIEE